MAEPDFSKTVLEELILYFEPVLAGVSDPGIAYGLLDTLGWNATSLFGPPPNSFVTAWNSVGTAVTKIEKAAASPPQSLDDLMQTLTAVKETIDALHLLPQAVAAGQPPELASLAVDLIDLLTQVYLERRAPAAIEILRLLTIVRPEDRPSVVKGSNLVRSVSVVERFDLSRIPLLLSDPIKVLTDYYLPSGLSTKADAALASVRIFGPIARVLTHMGSHAVIGRGESVPYLDDETEKEIAKMLTAFWHIDNDETDAELGFSARILSAEEQGPGVAVLPVGAGQIDIPVGFWNLSLSLAANGGVLLIKAGKIEAGVGDATLEARVTVRRSAGKERPMRVGSDTGTHLEANNLSFGFEGVFKHFSADTDVVEYGASGLIRGARLVVSAADGDSFLKKILPAEASQIEFDLGLGWSNQRGVYFIGSAGLDVTLPVHKDVLGLLTIDSISLSLKLTDSNIRALIAATASVGIGPIHGSIEQVGLRATVTFPPEGGNLGPMALDLAFKPPKGLGVAVDANAVVGGGYLFFDDDNKQYAGILQLEVKSGISLKAIGLLTTRMPDGSSGFSLLVLITAEFPPIQLGYGFTLNGVGGLLGVHRTVVSKALEDGVRNGALDSIMFPPDPVRNASQIISDLRTIFPPEEGRYTLGPMVMLGWGTPPVLRIEIALILELFSPIRLGILGKMVVGLPAEEAAVVYLRLDVYGRIDFDRSEAGVTATLVDSRIATFPITGDLAMRASWGETKVFAISAGGFNPRFQPPPDFPKLEPLTIVIADEDNFRLRLEAYLALTANTTQMGARLDLYAAEDFGELGSFSVAGHLGFDVIVYLPFEVVADVNASICINRNRQPLIAADLHGTLTGTGPWHIFGAAVFDFLGKREVPFDEIFGNPDPPDELSPIDVEALLIRELSDVRNWNADLLNDATMMVSLVRTAPSDVVLAHPLGLITVRQRLVPLKKTISVFGASIPQGAARFELTGAKIGDSPVADIVDIYEAFSPGQFETLTDDEKLTRPSFEQMVAGAQFGGTGVRFSDSAVPVDLNYDDVRVDVDSETGKRKQILTEHKFSLSTDMYSELLKGGAAAVSSVQHRGSGRYRGPDQKVHVMNERYIVAKMNDLGAAPPDMSRSAQSGTTYEECQAALNSWLTEHEDGASLQIVGAHEVSFI
jgi:hypothetical protein